MWFFKKKKKRPILLVPHKRDKEGNRRVWCPSCGERLVYGNGSWKGNTGHFFCAGCETLNQPHNHIKCPCGCGFFLEIESPQYITHIDASEAEEYQKELEKLEDKGKLTLVEG